MLFHTLYIYITGIQVFTMPTGDWQKTPRWATILLLQLCFLFWREYFRFWLKSSCWRRKIQSSQSRLSVSDLSKHEPVQPSSASWRHTAEGQLAVRWRGIKTWFNNEVAITVSYKQTTKLDILRQNMKLSTFWPFCPTHFCATIPLNYVL